MTKMKLEGPRCVGPWSAWALCTTLATGCLSPNDRYGHTDAKQPTSSAQPTRFAEPTGSAEPLEEDARPGIGAAPVKPNVMLLVDRSGSMSEPSDCGEAVCPSKWNELLGLGPYLAEAKRLARLGLAMFPSSEDHGCSVRSILHVPLSETPNVDEQILGAAMAARPGGRTPVADALDAIGRMGGLDDPDRENILLVLTDGRPNCSCADDDACERGVAVAAVDRLRATGIDVDIIGFGSSAREADETLTAMAHAAGDEDYYQADTIEDLIGTLYEVGVRSTPCRFHLDEWPKPDQLVVWKDGTEVPACTSDGYTYDPTTGVVEFRGASCVALRDGERHDVWFDSRS